MQFKRVLKYLFFVCLIVGLGLLYGFSKSRNEVKKVDTIRVDFHKKETTFLTHEIVNKLLIQNDETVKNKEKSVIDLYLLEQQVINNPYVEEASVFLTVNGTLETVIKQRTPIARIMSSSNSYYVDKQGVVVPLSDNYSARVLLVSGVKNEAEVNQILPFLNRITNDNFLKKEIIGVVKTQKNELLLLVRSGDYKIEFGNISDMEIKFKKLKAFYNKTFDDKTINNYKKISLKYHNQVVCTK